ncbi:type II secretion system protein [Demequina sp.]|uniref:type II secretion system protein n=1 Tax=Demequina sp. TaxID=2050685 RepID=UPI0025B8BAED|nr:prepilin-type N-terminal cleavage/methylation domain-containing protein [Demequina sp.]
MMARVRKQLAKEDKGFTLIELLVVMIIIGILAAIAIPIFLNQRKKAEDSAAKADVSTLGKEMATYYVDATGTPPTVSKDATSGHWLLGTDDVGNASANVVFDSQTSTAGTEAVTWCVSVSNPSGDVAATDGFKYSAEGGLEPGTCDGAV